MACDRKCRCHVALLRSQIQNLGNKWCQRIRNPISESNTCQTFAPSLPNSYLACSRYGTRDCDIVYHHFCHRFILTHMPTHLCSRSMWSKLASAHLNACTGTMAKASSTPWDTRKDCQRMSEWCIGQRSAFNTYRNRQGYLTPPRSTGLHHPKPLFLYQMMTKCFIKFKPHLSLRVFPIAPLKQNCMLTRYFLSIWNCHLDINHQVPCQNACYLQAFLCHFCL